jgi:hypothetical protein
MDDVEIGKAITHSSEATSSKLDFFCFFTIFIFSVVINIIKFFIFFVFSHIIPLAQLLLVSIEMIFIQIISQRKRIGLVQIDLVLSNIRVDSLLFWTTRSCGGSCIFACFKASLSGLLGLFLISHVPELVVLHRLIHMQVVLLKFLCLFGFHVSKLAHYVFR